MADSRATVTNGVPRLKIDGSVIPACVYITYFDERNRYADFAAAGYRMYSVNVSLSDLPLNPPTGFAPFSGVFDDPNGPDFRSVDRDIRRILAARPDAWIFPRIRITMPRWWIDRHPPIGRGLVGYDPRRERKAAR